MDEFNKSDNESDSDNEISNRVLKSKRFGVLASSDDDEETNSIANLADNNSLVNIKSVSEKSKFNSSVDNDIEKEIIPLQHSNEANNGKSRLLSASDFESENENSESSDINKSCSNKEIKYNNVKSSDRESVDEEEQYLDISESTNFQNVKKNVKKLKKKSSNKIENKLQIRSETQRMEREMSVHLPYHRPKQRTLREFLSRKKNHLKADALRLTSENMIHTWEGIDKNIRETAEFFKSESEDDCSNASPTREPLVNLNQSSPNDVTTLSKNKTDVPTNVIDHPTIPYPLENTGPPDLHDFNDPTESDTVIPIPELPIESNEINLNVEKSESQLGEENISKVVEIEAQSKTEKWLKDVAAFEKRESLRNKLQLSPSVLDKVPTLTNDPFVDLDDSDSESSLLQPGAKLLMNRLLSGRQPTAKPQSSLKTTVTERDDTGQVQNVTVEVLPFTQVNPIILDGSNPGAKLQKFREKLRNEIEAKWEEVYKKRCPENPVKTDFEEDVGTDEESAYEGECEESSEEESEPEEDDVEIKDKPRKFCEFGNSEAEESEVDEEDNGNSERSDSEADETIGENEPKEAVSESEEMDWSFLPAFQPGGGLLMGGSALTQQSQPLPFHDYSPSSSPAIIQSRSTYTPAVTSQRKEENYSTPQTPGNVDLPAVNSVKKNLFGAHENTYEDPDDPFLFVSGAFPDAAPQISEHKEPSPSQSKLKRIIVTEDSDQDNDDENGKKESIREVENVDNIEQENDDENSNKESNRAVENVDHQLTKSTSRKATKLVFSDDSDDENDAVGEKISEADVSEEEKGDEDVEYDSEENEVVQVRPGEFFEQEAELSESEWSGDEDEKGLDILEAEAGDADVLDNEQVASQLGRIHMRRIMDEDARDVRILQELLFEDGDLHSDGKGRDRKFRWKHLGAGFDLNGELKDEDGSDAETDAADAILAKVRHEKTQFLMQLQQEGKLENLEEECSGKENSLINLGRQLLQRINTGAEATTTTTIPSKSFLTRGSFLSKDEKFLKRLSRVATGGTDNPLGPSNSKKFVFAIQEKEVQIDEETTKEGLKRKAVSCKETVKRAKVIFNDQPSLLDQLR